MISRETGGPSPTLNRHPADPITHALTLLGTLPTGSAPADSDEHAPAIVRIEKTALTAGQAEQLLSSSLKDAKLIEGTDIVSRSRMNRNARPRAEG